jgi:trans-aconitate methyltransferase
MLTGFLKRFGPKRVKRWIWDREFRRGAYQAHAGVIMLELINRYAPEGPVLDLGCGCNGLGPSLPGRVYTGVDISPVAIEKSLKTFERSYVVHNIETYTPDHLYDIICFKDSIYYIPFHRIGPVLRRYRRYLAPTGVYIVKLAEGDRFRRIVGMIERQFHVLEKRGGNPLFLVFR